MPGFEPGTSATQRRRATRLRHTPTRASVSRASRRDGAQAGQAVREHHRRRRQQRHPGHRHRAGARRAGLLVDHQRGEQRHPDQARHAGREHHQHQRPAAADAERSVAGAEAKSAAHAALVVAAQELPGVAALVEAGVLQRRELERSREREHAGPDGPVALVQPGARLDHGVESGVEGERQGAEGAPDRGVAADEGGHRPAVRGSASRRDRVHPHHRQARGQHHRGDHHLPGEQEEQAGQQRRRPIHDQRVVVDERRRPRHLGRDRDGPGGGDAGQYRRGWSAVRHSPR